MVSEQTAIIGLGLIGSSLGLALRRRSPGTTVVGYDIDTAITRQAERTGAITHAVGSIQEACRGSDTVILAPPVNAILALLRQLAPHLEPDTVVTDTGGTKAEIVTMAEAAFGESSSVAFVGGHPLAGRLRSGVSQPDTELFEGSIYCLTPTPLTPAWGVERAADLIETIGAQPYFVSATEHDALLAAVSHLPYFSAVALVRALTAQSGWSEMGSLAAGGFRTASSLVDGSPAVWADVAATNSGPLRTQLDQLIATLTELRELISSGDGRLTDVLNEAHTARRAWMESRGETQPSDPSPEAPRRFPFFRR
ncbi:MAG TPA: prephenate dehydrogenase [Chloroflexota bacterium]